MNRDVIKKPIVTEKATALQARGQYVFMVAPRATKTEVKQAIKELYKVDATAVAMIVTESRAKHFRGRPGLRRVSKKAIVTLKSGQTIDLVA